MTGVGELSRASIHDRLPGRAPARRRQGPRPGRAPRARAPRGHARAAAAPPRRRAGSEARARGDRAPARPRHLRPARRRALGRGPPAAAGGARASGGSSASTSRSSRGARRRARGRSRRRSGAIRGCARAWPSAAPAPREARTHFTLERALPTTSLLRLRLETGRTHQIRVHLQAIGHPVLRRPRVRHRRPARAASASSCTPRAWPSRIPSPASRVEVSSPLPADLQRRARARRRAILSG